ncbi:MAG: hypothetical protein N2738_07575 [Thermodesulfovibrionales bacterium]|nr:hypothetical protein [Thermodesulfovibrionales bacterium]
MKIFSNVVFILTSTALGSLAGLVSNPKKPCKSACIGALMGLSAGAAVSAFISNLNDTSIKYYGKSSGLYEGNEEEGII